ncbi:MFS transporter [Acinetobacter silvestris]|uniref:MFS transporter n=2 Tax=Acinetobacter silvestris TaxID=1977882 RepID=A0A1Y3CJ41_9GAMM|nr:MFS transporter [Acinetobacter silvestris]OTG65624.1 MFS transporter [Acinetobacter silvestris]
MISTAPKLYLLLFSLYWAQGLPVGFMTHALPVILRYQGVSLAQIGGFGLLMAPWAIKVLWAPWVDRCGYKSIGHYRSWILPAQLLSVIILIILSFLPIQALNQPLYLGMFFVALLCMNGIGATQDIATDGLAVSILKEEQQHWGNMFQVVGSRLGFIIGGGAILWAMDWLTWQATFLILAGIVLINTIPIWLYKEPEHKHREEKHREEKPLQRVDLQSIIPQIRSYLRYFLTSKTMLWWFVVLCSIKLTDGLSGPIIKPLLVDLGLSLSQIGIYVTMLGAVAALLGAGIASYLLKYIQRSNALLLFSILKIMSLLGFVWLAHLFENKGMIQPWWIYLINACEDLFSAMLLVVILTIVMQYSRKMHAATDFTFQVSIMAMLGGVLYTVSGVAGDLLGYQDYLSLIVFIGMVCLVPMFIWKRSVNR